MLTFETKNLHCLCGAVLEKAAAIRHDSQPKPGSVALCTECGRFMEFDEKLEGQPRTDGEILVKVGAKTFDHLLSLRAKFRESLFRVPTQDVEAVRERWRAREREFPAGSLGANTHQPLRVVLHSALARFSEDSPYKSGCPACGLGLLLVRRLSGQGFKLSRIDNCTHCLQFYWYADDSINGEEFVEPAEPVPSRSRGK